MEKNPVNGNNLFECEEAGRSLVSCYCKLPLLITKLIPPYKLNSGTVNSIRAKYPCYPPSKT